MGNTQIGLRLAIGVILQPIVPHLVQLLPQLLVAVLRSNAAHPACCSAMFAMASRKAGLRGWTGLARVPIHDDVCLSRRDGLLVESTALCVFLSDCETPQDTVQAGRDFFIGM